MSNPMNIPIFDPTFTQNVIHATDPSTSPRLRKVTSSLIQHLHDFMRENLVTMDELLSAITLASSSPTRP